MRNVLRWGLLPALALAGCVGGGDGTGDGIDDAFGGGGKADASGVAEGSAEARGVLRVANESSLSTLRHDVRVEKRAATNIVGARKGADGQVGTADDHVIATLSELDAISYVGPKALNALLAYARDHGFIDDDPDPVDTEVCAEHHAGATAEGDAVEICDALFDTAPRIRPPADEVVEGGTSTLYMALELAGVPRFVDRSGAAYYPVDAHGQSLGAAALATGLPSAFRMPSNRNLYLVYRVEGTVGTADVWGSPATSIRVTGGGPAILVEGSAIDGTFMTWEGTVSRRISDTRWDDAQRVPVRIALSQLVSIDSLPVWGSGERLADGERFQAIGRIENATAGVRAADGTCMAALTDLGSANPFRGAPSPDVKLYRIAGMHFAGDQVIVLDYPVGTTGLGQNGMGGLRTIDPASLLQVDPSAGDGTHGTIDIYPHGTPNGHHMELHPVLGGGGGC